MPSKRQAGARRLARVASPLLLLAGLAVLPGSSASASCIGPSLVLTSADPSGALRPGGDLRVDGQGFFDGCDDTGDSGGDGLGCGGAQGPAPSAPLDNVHLVLRQAGHTWTVSTADAREHAGDITWTGLVPSGLRSGPASLKAGTATLRISIS